MPWLYYLILLALLFTGLVINILGLPGLWLMVGSVAVYAWLTHVGVYVGWPTLWTLIGLALAAEIVEFLAAATSFIPCASAPAPPRVASTASSASSHLALSSS